MEVSSVLGLLGSNSTMADRSIYLRNTSTYRPDDPAVKRSLAAIEKTLTRAPDDATRSRIREQLEGVPDVGYAALMARQLVGDAVAAERSRKTRKDMADAGLQRMTLYVDEKRVKAFRKEVKDLAARLGVTLGSDVVEMRKAAKEAAAEAAAPGPSPKGT